MILNQIEIQERLKVLTNKLHKDFGIRISENKTLSALKKIKSNADLTLCTLKESSITATSPEFAAKMLISECAGLMIQLKEKKITESKILLTAPRLVLEAYCAGADLKTLMADVQQRLNLDDTMMENFAGAFASLVQEEYNAMMDIKTDHDAVDRKLGKMKGTKLKSPLEQEDEEFQAQLQRVRDFHRKRESEKSGKMGESCSKLAESLSKRTRLLCETNVEEAEIMMSTKGFSQDLQEMIEKLGRMTNEDLPPVTDHIRVVYGLDAATNFQESTHEVLQAVMDTLYSAKFFIDEAVIRMSEHKVPGAATDMDVSVGDEFVGDVDDDFATDLGDEGLDADPELDAAIEDEVVSDLEEPLGRMKKESAAQLLAQINVLQENIKTLKVRSAKKKF